MAKVSSTYTIPRRGWTPGIEDPRLTPLGHEQAAAAAVALAGDGVARIIASPYTRALQTAAPLAQTLGLPVLVTPAVRERYAFVCDVGSPVRDLAAAWPGHDFSGLADIWWPQENEPHDRVIERARAFRAEMAADPQWERTVVVSHWGFIMALTGISVQNGQWLRVDPTVPGPDQIGWRV